MAARRSSSSDFARIKPLLAEVKDNLQGNLDLGALARAFGASPFQFHRKFSTAVGETPRRLIERLRLERAAYLLAVTQARVIDIALDVGFESHETFSRAFRRLFACSPTAWRREAKVWQTERVERNRHFRGDGCRFTEVWFEQRVPAPMLAIRRLGPYGDLNVSASREPYFGEIEACAAAQGARLGEARWGLFPDDPNLTPPQLQCADLCIPLLVDGVGSARVRRLELPGGLYGKIGHFGPGPTVGQAYRQLADAIRRAGLIFREHPPVQVFLEDHEQSSEIWFPIRRR